MSSFAVRTVTHAKLDQVADERLYQKQHQGRPKTIYLKEFHAETLQSVLQQMLERWGRVIHFILSLQECEIPSVHHKLSY